MPPPRSPKRRHKICRCLPFRSPIPMCRLDRALTAFSGGQGEDCGEVNGVHSDRRKASLKKIRPYVETKWALEHDINSVAGIGQCVELRLFRSARLGWIAGISDSTLTLVWELHGLGSTTLTAEFRPPPPALDVMGGKIGRSRCPRTKLASKPLQPCPYSMSGRSGEPCPWRARYLTSSPSKIWKWQNTTPQTCLFTHAEVVFFY